MCDLAAKVLSQIEPLLDDALLDWQKDLSLLIKHKSYQDIKSASAEAPFGTGIRGAFDCFSRIATERGFEVHDFAGFAIDARYPANVSHEQEYVAVLGHLDVVPAKFEDGWGSDPFTLSERDGFLFGRGVNDDKGPLLLCLYALDLLKNINYKFSKPVRIIAGGAEETSWACVKHYFANNIQPIAAFSPDGNFPIINHELGILDLVIDFPHKPNSEKQLLAPRMDLQIVSPKAANKVCSKIEVTASEEKGTRTFNLEGVSALSRNPQRGKNAMDLLLDDFSAYGLDFALLSELPILKFYKSYLYSEEGTSSQNLLANNPILDTKDKALFTQSCTGIRLDGEASRLHIDIRYPITMTKHALWSELDSLLSSYGATVAVVRDLPPLYCAPDSPLIQALSSAYEEVMQEKLAAPQAKGAASYARALSNGIAFGPTFPGENPRTHETDERFSLASARRLLQIYTVAIATMLAANMEENRTNLE